MSKQLCTQCGQPAQHEAHINEFSIRPKWLPYCCACFNHNWRPQRPVEGQECRKELVEMPPPQSRFEWRWKEGEDG